jgi:DNA modification methylase
MPSEIKLICGDCLEVMKKIPDKSIDLVLTDPPYNVKKDFLNDDLSVAEFTDFIRRFTIESLRVSKLLLFFTGSKYLPAVMGGVSQYIDLCYFYKPYANNKGIITDWNHCDLVIACGEKPIKKPKNNFYQYLKFPTTDGKPHPCPKPVEIMKKFIVDFSEEGDTILDPFLGSGTTAVACKELNRNCIGIEISKEYFENAQKRLANTQEMML